MTVRFTGGSFQRGIIERNRDGNINRLVLTEAQNAAAVAAGEVVIAIRARPGWSVSASIIRRTTSSFGSSVTTVADGSYQPVTLPLDAGGVRTIAFGVHIQHLLDVVVGSDIISGDLGAWVDARGGLPIGATSPQRQSYHSVSGRMLGTTVTPASEAFTLAIRGITKAKMESDGRRLIRALNEGEVRFDINATDGGLESFTAWADGDIGRPQLRVGSYYEWDLNLRRAHS